MQNSYLNQNPLGSFILNGIFELGVSDSISSTSTPSSAMDAIVTVGQSFSTSFIPGFAILSSVTSSELLAFVITGQLEIGNSVTVVTTFATVLSLESSLTAQADVNVVIVSEVFPDMQIEAVVLAEAVFRKYVTTMVDTSSRATMQGNSHTATMISTSYQAIMV